MTPIQESFLEVLRAGLWETPLKKKYTGAELLQIWEIARQQSCRGLVAQAILSSDIEISQKFETTLQNFLYANVKTNNLLNHTVAVVVKYLRDNGIESVLLKGQGIGSYYKNPMLRECGDIDLYVGVENYEKACRLMDELCGEEAKKKAEENKKHYGIKYGDVDIEIHRFSQTIPGKLDKVYQGISDEGLTENLVPMQFEGVKVMTPENNFNAFYIFLHIWHHFLTRGIGYRQFCDWMMFLSKKRKDISQENLKSYLVDIELEKQWEAFGNILFNNLGADKVIIPLYKEVSSAKVNDIMDIVFREGNFGHEREDLNNRSEHYLFAKTQALGGHIVRYYKMMKLFPKSALNQFYETIIDGFKRVFNDLKFW